MHSCLQTNPTFIFTYLCSQLKGAVLSCGAEIQKRKKSLHFDYVCMFKRHMHYSTNQVRGHTNCKHHHQQQIVQSVNKPIQFIH